ncbi:hypothetical protein I4U23_016669 [Adineta vaga]|nr:hypothetical protein I4U23_016669 [Adineta vaga]
MVNGIELADIKSITSKHVLTWITYNTIRKNDNDLHLVTKEKLKYVIKSRAFEYQKKLKDCPMDSLITAYVSENVDSIEQLYGNMLQERNPRDLLNRDMGVYLTDFYRKLKGELGKKKKFPDFIKEIDINLNDVHRPKMKRILDRVDDALPNNVLTTNADLDCDQENEGEIEEIKHVEVSVVKEMESATEICWNFDVVFEKHFIEKGLRQEKSYPKLKKSNKSFEFTDIDGLKTLKWNNKVFVTDNFIKTIEGIDEKNRQYQNDYLKPVNMILIHKKNGEACFVIISLFESQHLSELFRKKEDPEVRLTHIDDVNGPTMVPINTVELTKEEVNNTIAVIRLCLAVVDSDCFHKDKKISKGVGVGDYSEMFDIEVSVETTDEISDIPIVLQHETRKELQRRTFSHWPHRSSEFINQLVEAGFYGCNDGDRAICVECNFTHQHWRPHIDDPFEIHRRISPECRYVQTKLMGLEATPSPPPSPPPPSTPIPVINANLSSTVNVAVRAQNTVHAATEYEGVVPKSYSHPEYAEVTKRRESFWTCSSTNLPSVDDLVRAGFFYAGTRTIVTCFYCNGSLQNCESNRNPAIEHVRQFPRCAYARQLCGDDLYRRIQQEQHRIDNMCQHGNLGSRSDTTDLTINRLLNIFDANTINRLVAARLDSPISQRLMNTNFNREIATQCWEDQLRIKETDFHSELDLVIACTIRQKLNHITSNNEVILNPQDAEMTPIRQNRSTSTNSHASGTILSLSTITTTSAAQPRTLETILPIALPNEAVDLSRNNEESLNPCAICLSEEKQLACIPCGHLIACVPCGHSMKTCPFCRKEIKAFVRIYT